MRQSREALIQKQKDRCFNLFESVSEGLRKTNVPSYQQLKKVIPDRLFEKSQKLVLKDLRQSSSRRLFSLYKYRVKGSFNSCMHFYKRDLSPVKEQFPLPLKPSPYSKNFQNYGVNLSTSDFKRTLLKGMGDSVSCITSRSEAHSIQTFTTTNELPMLTEMQLQNNGTAADD